MTGSATPAPLVLSAVADTKVYDGTPGSTGAATVVSGVKGADTIASVTHALDASGAGPRALAVTGYSINDGNSGANYSVTAQAAAGSIVPANLVVVADDKTRPQGEPNPPLTASFRGFVGAETTLVLSGTLNLSTAATAGSPSGSYPIVANGLGATNYSISYLDGTLAVVAPLFTQAPFGLDLAQRDKRLALSFGIGSRCFGTSLDAPPVGSWLDRPLAISPECSSSRLVGDNR